MNVTPELGFVVRGGNSARFEFTGGQIQGQVVVQGATLYIAPSATGSGQFLMWGATNLESDIGATHTLIVDGSLAGGGSATLNIPFESSLTNRGTLIIQTPEELTSGAISLSPPGQQFTNELGASLDFNPGAGSSPSLLGRLYNKGTVNVRRSITLGNSNDAHTNTATGTFHMFNDAVVTIQGTNPIPFVNESDAQSPGVVAGTGTLNMSNGYVGTFQNGGLVQPGGDQTAGTLTVAGHYTQTTTGSLDIELGGMASGQFDLLAVSNNAALAGTINISLLPGYTPALGDSFTVMTYAAETGDFTTYTGLNLGNGLVLQPNLTFSSLVLTVIQSSFIPPEPTDTNKRTRQPSRR